MFVQFLNRTFTFPGFQKLQKERQAGEITNPGDQQQKNCYYKRALL